MFCERLVSARMIDLRAFLCPVNLPARKAPCPAMLSITPNYVMLCAVQNAQCNIKEPSSNTVPISLRVTIPSPDGASPPFHLGGGGYGYT